MFAIGLHILETYYSQEKPLCVNFSDFFADPRLRAENLFDLKYVIHQFSHLQAINVPDIIYMYRYEEQSGEMCTFQVF